MAEDQDDSQKTEEPTARKLEEARSKGQIVQSKELVSWAGLLGGGIAVTFLAPFVAQRVGDGILIYIERPDMIPMDQAALGDVLRDSAVTVAGGLLVAMLFIAALILAALLAQAGFVFSGESLIPKPDKISPIKGLKRMFSIRSLVELLKAIVKLIVVGAVLYAIIAPEVDRANELIQMDIDELVQEIRGVIIRIFIAVVVIVAFMAALDYAYQRYEFMKNMRMTKQEVKDEHRQAEGDPMVKARLRQIRLERARQRMIAAVPKADVVITNPTHFAVALQYDGATMTAPRLTAKGADAVAARIREVAREHDVPIVENPPLARALYDTVELDQEVPPQHYKAVAEVISYVFRLKRKPMPA